MAAAVDGQVVAAAQPAAPERRVLLDRQLVTGAVVGGALVIAGGCVAAVDSAAPFAHGSWLAAFLVLVGGVAQIALPGGRVALRVAAPAPRLATTELGLWTAGSLIVPAGVLAGAPVLVGVGSVPLLVALVLFARDVRGASARRPALAYQALLLGLAVSAGIGCVLAALG